MTEVVLARTSASGNVQISPWQTRRGVGPCFRKETEVFEWPELPEAVAGAQRGRLGAGGLVSPMRRPLMTDSGRAVTTS